MTPWTFANMDQLTYAKLPWEKKRGILVQMGVTPALPVERPSKSGSYLWDTWCHEEAKKIGRRGHIVLFSEGNACCQRKFRTIADRKRHQELFHREAV